MLDLGQRTFRSFPRVVLIDFGTATEATEDDFDPTLDFEDLHSGIVDFCKRERLCRWASKASHHVGC